MSKDVALTAFAHEVSRSDAEINLTRAVLLMGAFEYQDLDVSLYESRVDKLAEVAEHAITGGRVTALSLAECLFVSLGFSGNQEDYLDPRNSYLNEVLERRLGIPISLSVLYIEVARRLGLNAHGVGLPGHFIVSVLEEHDGQSHPVYLDPFHGGAVMTEEDCRERVQTITNGSVEFDRGFLQPVAARYILMRMLNNLKNAYATSSDYERALQVVQRLLILNPGNLEEVRNLGLLYGALGQTRRAVELLEKYLEGRPNAPDAASVRKYLVSISRNMARWN